MTQPLLSFLSGFELLFCGMFPVGLALFAFWVWILVDCLMNEPSDGNDKLIWTVLIVFLPFLGSVIYFFVRRPERKTKFGR